MTVKSSNMSTDHDSPTAERPASDGRSPERTSLPVGTSVEVRSRFDRRWARGFSIAAVTTDAYQLRRVSDGSVLPAWFPRDEIRRTALN
jgi:hypothetical protein